MKQMSMKVLILIAGVFLTLAFQNCGKPGGNSETYSAPGTNELSSTGNAFSSFTMTNSTNGTSVFNSGNTILINYQSQYSTGIYGFHRSTGTCTLASNTASGWIPLTPMLPPSSTFTFPSGAHQWSGCTIKYCLNYSPDSVLQYPLSIENGPNSICTSITVN